MKDELRKYLAPVAGSVCLWAPEALLLEATPLAAPSGATAIAPYPYFLFAATLSVLLFIAFRGSSLRLGRPLAMVGALLYAAGTAQACLIALGPEYPNLLGGLVSDSYGASTAVAGLGFGLLMMGWGAFYVDIPLSAIKTALVSVAVVQPLLITPIDLFEPLRLALPLMPLASLWCLRRSLELVPQFGAEQPRLEHRSMRIKPRYIVGVASISLSFGAIKHLSLVSQAPFGWVEGLATGLLVAAIIALLFRRGDAGYSLAWKAIGIIMLAGFALLLASQQNWLFASLAVASVGYGIFEYVLWVATVDLAKYSAQPPLKFIGWTFVFTIGGQGVGSLAAFALPPALVTAADAAVAPVFLGALIVIAVAVIWLLPAEAVQALFSSPERRPECAVPDGCGAGDSDPHAPSLETRLKDAYGLTNRETEIALLLAGGRSARYVQDVLVISEGTVWTHIRHIYQKMNVSSRQEFLTAVEKERLGKER